MNKSLQPVASYPFQALIFFDGYYSILYFGLEVFCLTFKGYRFFFPPNVFGIEVFCLFAFLVIQFTRLFLGRRANKSEASKVMLLFIILCLPNIFCYCFFLGLQTYALQLEVIINSIGLAFILGELLLGIFSFITFANTEKNL
eukprot:TRINITY_DN3179_c0_g2_i12.p1 TRINITY_DN3179_c0_g2~~TRINITY_DN3179_c0_g2_i12.p1  ORF type:complete len:143 (-),score=11.74 TRINITY_DN3179_c0_g2_i12:183-611(-)